MRIYPEDTQSPWQIIGAPLAAGLLYMNGVAGLRGWQWLFIIEGCLTTIYGVILKVRLPGILEAYFGMQHADHTSLQGLSQFQCSSCNQLSSSGCSAVLMCRM